MSLNTALTNHSAVWRDIAQILYLIPEKETQLNSTSNESVGFIFKAFCIFYKAM